MWKPKAGIVFGMILFWKLCIFVGKVFLKIHFPLLSFEFNGLHTAYTYNERLKWCLINVPQKKLMKISKRNRFVRKLDFHSTMEVLNYSKKDLLFRTKVLIVFFSFSEIKMSRSDEPNSSVFCSSVDGSYEEVYQTRSRCKYSHHNDQFFRMEMKSR